MLLAGAPVDGCRGHLPRLWCFECCGCQGEDLLVRPSVVRKSVSSEQPGKVSQSDADQGFRTRHSNLTIRKPQPLSYYRALFASKKTVSITDAEVLEAIKTEEAAK